MFDLCLDLVGIFDEFIDMDLANFVVTFNLIWILEQILFIFFILYNTLLSSPTSLNFTLNQ